LDLFEENTQKDILKAAENKYFIHNKKLGIKYMPVRKEIMLQ